ncbi:MAG TPA: cytochrome c [Pseudomonadales bacterium]|nr:cytochrome c [Pseudomonadales bacterium]
MKRFLAIAIAGLSLGAALPGAADQGLIDYRQAVYKSIGGHMSAIAGVLKREAPHVGDLPMHARGIAELAPLTLHLFPEASADGRTEALAAIWEDPDAFDEKRSDFIEAATAFGAVADADMDTYVGAFRTLGGTCKGCHDNFKAD